jgi:Domain of unknown function (DUF4234)
MNEMTARIDPMTMNQTGVARASDRPAGLKRQSVILMIVLTMITAGLYYPFWFLLRRDALNRLDAQTKLSLSALLLILAGTAINTFGALASGSSSPEQAFGENVAMILTLFRISTGILALVQCFFIKQILEDHLTGPDGDGSTVRPQVELSVPMTFFFGVFYLQHVINRDIVGYH